MIQSYFLEVPLHNYDKMINLLNMLKVDSCWSDVTKISTREPLFGYVMFGSVIINIKCSKIIYDLILKHGHTLLLTKQLPTVDKNGRVILYNTSHKKQPL